MLCKWQSWEQCVCGGIDLLVTGAGVVLWLENRSTAALWLLALLADWVTGEAEGVCMLISFRRWSYTQFFFRHLTFQMTKYIFKKIAHIHKSSNCMWQHMVCCWQTVDRNLNIQWTILHHSHSAEERRVYGRTHGSSQVVRDYSLKHVERIVEDLG